jgi:perosamine synthetase
MDQQIDLTDKLALHGGEPSCKVNFGPRWVFDETDRLQLQQVMDRGEKVWRSGDKLREFQRELAKAFGIREVVPTGSGTAAIHAAFGALNFEPGDEVITTAATDVGSIIGLMAQNLIPVFADWSPYDFNIDPENIERHITERTRAILVVHLFGIPCEMEPILEIAKRRGLRVIEDCAQSHLAEYRGQLVGTFGDIAGFSFGMKTLSTDQGGMVGSSDGELASRARGFLSKGSVRENNSWLPYERLGTFAPMTDLQAAIGISQLAKLEDATRRRQMVAAILDDTFAVLKGFRTAPQGPENRNVYYCYPYHLDATAAGVSLDEFVAALRAEGVIDAFGPYMKGLGLHRRAMLTKMNTYGNSGYPLRDISGQIRVDYECLRLPNMDAALPGVGFFHMRNSFTNEQAESIAGAVLKVARHFSLAPISLPVYRPTQVLPPHKPALVESTIEQDKPTTLKPAPRQEGSFDFSNFGAVAGGGVHGAHLNDAAMDAMLLAIGEQGARIFIPRGIYYFSRPIRIHSRRNLRFLGEGGNVVHPGTRLVYSGSDSEGLFDIASSIHCGFECIELAALGGCGEQVVILRCDDERSDGLSSSSIAFLDCTIRVIKKTQDQQICVRMRDSANISFKRCWFKGASVGVELGNLTRPSNPTRSNGLVNTILFESCHIFSDITGLRASNVRFSDCMFSIHEDGKASVIDFGSHENGKVRNVTITNCFAIEARNSPETFLRQGSNGCGLVFQGNRISGYSCAVNIDGSGHAIVQANEFSQTNSGANDIRIGVNAIEVYCSANESSQTTKAGNESVLKL